MLLCSQLLSLLVLATSARAEQTILGDLFGSSSLQHVDFEQIYQAYPEYTLDLSERRLIQFDPSAPPIVLTELEKIELKAQGVKFFDITDSPDLGSHGHLRESSSVTSYPAPNSTKQVESVIKTLSKERMMENLKTFTSFRTRYYRSETGRESQLWLLSRINEITSSFASEALRDRISVSEFPHSWVQKSIIVKIDGTSSEEGVIIVGAHQDSAHTWPFLPAPGADDDGSGTVTILEAYQGLISAGFSPKRTVEFHFYSAEEGGLLGSQEIAREYESRVNVLAMSQFDMTAWVKRGTKEAVGVVVDFTDKALTDFNKALVDKYLSIPYVETKCGYACSDHASWSKAGYPSIFSIESLFEESNPYIHSGNDRIDVSDEFSFDHMLEFTKLAVAFAIELGKWEQE